MFGGAYLAQIFFFVFFYAFLGFLGFCECMVKKFGIIVLLEQVWMYAGKREGFDRGIRENEFERKIKCRNVS